MGGLVPEGCLKLGPFWLSYWFSLSQIVSEWCVHLFSFSYQYDNLIFFTSRKRLRAKNTPDLHLSYSKTEGKAGMVEKKDSASKNTLYFKWKYKV